MKQIVSKIFNRRVAKGVFFTIATLLLAALATGAVYGYMQFTSLQQKVNDVDARLTQVIGEPAENEGEEYNEAEAGSVEFTLASQAVKTLRVGTTYDQEAQSYIYEPTEVLEVSLDVTNGTGTLYDSTTTRFYAATVQGNLISEASYSMHSDDVQDDAMLTLAPNGSGKVVLYFQLDGQDFTSIFIDNSYNFGQTHSIEL